VADLPYATRPKLKSGYVLEAVEHGWSLRHRSATRSILLGECEQEALALLDGEHTIEEAAIEWCHRRQTIDVEPLLLFVAQLHENGFLETAADEQLAGIFGGQGFADFLQSLCVYRRPSELLRNIFLALSSFLRRPLTSSTVIVMLLLFTVVGAILWAYTLADAPINILHVTDSYFFGLLYLLAVNAILSVLGAIAAVAVQRSYGIPTGTAFVGVTVGLPGVWVEAAEGDGLTWPRRLWLHLAASVFEGAVGALLVFTALFVAEQSYRNPLLTAGSVAYLRLFMGLCPWTQSALTRAVASATKLPELRMLAVHLFRGRLWRALSQPVDHAERSASLYSLVMLFWSALGLRLIALLITPLFPVLLVDISRGMSPLETAAAGLMLLLLSAIAFGAVTLLGLAVLTTLGRWIVTHPVWGQPGWQLVAILAVVTAVVAGLNWLGTNAPGPFTVLSITLGTLGVLLTWVASLLAFFEHRGGRMRLLVIPLALASVPAWLVLVLKGHFPATTLDTLALTVVFLIGVFVFGWIAYIWRQFSGSLGLFILILTYIGALMGGSLWPIHVVLLTAFTVIYALILLVLQRHTWLAPAWLLVALGAILLGVLRFVTPFAPLPVAGTEVTFVTVIMVVSAALVQWVWVLWSGKLTEVEIGAEASTSLDRHIMDVLVNSYARIAGQPGVDAVCRQLGENGSRGKGVGGTSELTDAKTTYALSPETTLQLLLLRLRRNLGPVCFRRLLARACQSLPWEKHLEAMSKFGLDDWLDPSPSLQRQTVRELLAGSLPFADLPDESLTEIVSHARLRRWEDGEAIAVHGRENDWLHVLFEGGAAVWPPVTKRRGDSIAFLSPGDSFGLEALAMRGTYPFSVTALGSALTISLHRRDLAAITIDPRASAALPDLVRRVRSLRFISVFHDLAEAQVAAFLAKAEQESYRRDDVIIRQGDPGDRFFIIRAGEVNVVQEEPGGQEHVATLGPGDCVGELALLFSVPRTATVIARGHVEVLALGRDDFLRVFPLHAKGSRALLHLSLSRVLHLADHSQ